MSSLIIERTIGGSTEKAAQMSNAQFGRQVTLPLGWGKIRVGIRLHMTNTGLNLPGTPRFALGFGHGTTNMVGDASCDNWIGLISVAATWLYYGADYTTNTSGISAAKKVGATLTTGGDLNPGALFCIGHKAALAEADRTELFVDITKGSPNYTVGAFYYNSNSLQDVSAANFRNDIILASPSRTNYATGSAAIAFDETAGALNAVQCWWNRSDVVMEICDLAVAVIS